MFKGTDAIEFSKKFTKNSKCKAYLFAIKWGKGYQCKKCGCTQYWKGRTRFHARCTSCDYDESVTANTLFHKIKIPLFKAFNISFRIVVSKKGTSTKALSRDFSVSQESAWLFKRKLQEAVSSEMRNQKRMQKIRFEQLLRGILISKRGSVLPNEVAELEKNKFLANKTDNKDTNKAKQARHDNLKKFTAPPAGVQKVGEGLFAHNFRLWINGVHHHCSLRFFEGYVNEYYFRFLHRKRMEHLWHNVILCFMKGKPYFYKPNET